MRLQEEQGYLLEVYVTALVNENDQRKINCRGDCILHTARMQKFDTSRILIGSGATYMARKMEDRQDRANNIILFGVPKSTEDTRVGRHRDVAKKIRSKLGANKR